jgi:membrane-bound lytic murein transglycosylase F
MPMFINIHKHHRINLRILAFFMILLSIAIIYHHVQIKKEKEKLVDLPKIKTKGELKALTLYSPTSYFIYRDKEMGYEYEICAQLAKSLGLKLKMIIAPNEKTMLEMLQRNEGDLVAYNVPTTMEDKHEFIFCGRKYLTHQVLVQQKKKSSKMISNVTQLIGKNIVVQKNSNYYSRLVHLNNEVGGGIHIKTIEADRISTEELIDMVALGKIDYTIADNNIAQYDKTFYKNINTSLAVSFNQNSFWVVRKTSPKLAAAINNWFSKNINSSAYQSITERYFELNKNLVVRNPSIRKDGKISPYDAMFKKQALKIGWDWRLIASIACQESDFNPNANNWTGASGLMQIMPRTARLLNINTDSLYDAETSIKGAVQLLKIYEEGLSFIKNKEQRQKMTIAAYNCGFGHIEDARALASKHKRNPNRWDGDNVEKYIYLKNRPEFYDDPVCKQGYLRGSETTDFVRAVWIRYKYWTKRGSVRH